MHPQVIKIQEILKSLLLEMKDERYMADPSSFSHDLAMDVNELTNLDIGWHLIFAIGISKKRALDEHNLFENEAAEQKLLEHLITSI